MSKIRIHNKRNQSIPLLLKDLGSKVERSILLGAKKYIDVQPEELTPDCFAKSAKRYGRILKLEQL